MLRLELNTLEMEGFDLDLLGFSEEELDALAAGAGDIAQTHGEPDATPEPLEAAVSAAGDVWILGCHRLVCGDATRPEDVDLLMRGEAADLVFTDPPYNVDYEGYTEDRLKIQGDRMTAEQYREFLAAVFAGCRRVVKPTASLYVCHPSLWQREFQNALEAVGFEVRCQLIWAKNTFAWGFGRYKFQHEPIFYCHIAGETDPWYGDKSQSTLWLVDKPAANRDHPTMKPVELVERALVNSSRKGDVVVDIFAGSGSTLIACERSGRRAHLMEIEPKYCDVVIRRWQEFTGGKTVLEGDGRAFEELRDERQRVPA
jgi:DNA modification methylase